jgi:predicted RNase H-like HicB family nuclease
MNSKGKHMLTIFPDLIERARGGWLAVSPQSAPIRFGVTGETKKDAIARFSQSAKAWVETVYGEEGRANIDDSVINHYRAV